jgi:putative component of membrane protein insertase Oxa1/YidC/SpoIIIJ protein YidD
VIRAGLAATSLVLVSACSHGAHVPGSPCSAGPGFEPWDAPAVPTSDDAPETDPGGAGTLVGVYQAHLRRPSLPTEDCPFEPTCSVFAQRAIAAHGAPGILLVVDRLLFREHPFAAINYEETCVDGRWRWRDPVP